MPTANMNIGPEIGLGWALGDAIKEQVLLIKMAWGGKSLDVDFRPPSSGGKVGPFYTMMVKGVKSALGNLAKLFPSYSGSYELAGFFWHQGWNDACGDGGANPSNYEKDLANLIKDVRKDFSGLPHAGKNLLWSIGVSGMLGYPPFTNAAEVLVIRCKQQSYLHSSPSQTRELILSLREQLLLSRPDSFTAMWTSRLGTNATIGTTTVNHIGTLARLWLVLCWT